MSNILSVDTGKGKELYDHMKEVLDIPDTAQSVKVEIDKESRLFLVTCSYLAKDVNAKA